MNVTLRLSSWKRPVQALAVAGIVTLLGVTASASAVRRVSVAISPYALTANATSAGVATMLLRVGGPDGFFSETQGDGGSVRWTLPDDALDGGYRYEVFAHADRGRTYSQTGRFVVRGGRMSERKPGRLAFSDAVPRVAAVALSLLLDAVVPAVEAQDALVTSDAPTVFFDDTSNGDGFDWEVFGAAGGDGVGGDFFSFGVFDVNQGTVPLIINSTPANEWALYSDFNGDVSLANDTFFVSRGGGAGIGTIVPEATIHVLRADGTAKILVEEISTTTAPRASFEIINNGPIGFNMTDTSAAQTWRFAAQPTGFRVSLDGTGGPEMEVGTGGTLNVGPGGSGALVLDAAGNLTIAGSLFQSSDAGAKENMDAFAGADVLERLGDLTIFTWNYKHDEPTARHVGPTAQAFHAAFGLGADNLHIAPMDVAGVALAGVKELEQALATVGREDDARLARLERRLAALEELIHRVAAQQSMQSTAR